MKTTQKRAEEMATEICQKINNIDSNNIEAETIHKRQELLEKLIKELEKRV